MTMMNKYFYTIVLMIMTHTLQAAAGTASCSMLRDHDARQFCMATSTGMSSYCSFIKDTDTRIRCFSSVGNGR